MAKTSNRREFLQLAQIFDSKKHFIGNWYASEKMDGMRAFWDGGITRGLYCHEVPWANTQKDGIRVNPPKATGLWTRLGKPIQAPLWFLDELPKFPLDGELTMGRGTFQQLISCARKLVPDDGEWERVHYYVFDLPDYTQVFADGTINVPNWSNFEITGVLNWLQMQRRYLNHVPKPRRFETVVFLLERDFPPDANNIVRALPQSRLSASSPKAIVQAEEMMRGLVEQGAEGVIVRNHMSIWSPQRVPHVLKMKPFEDAEVKVTGYISGRETDRGSKLIGIMGAMIVDFNGKRLELSGFTDDERTLLWATVKEELGSLTVMSNAFDDRSKARQWCYDNPGKEVPGDIYNPKFPRGSVVTIRYRELTQDGLPKEARYWRHHAGV